MRPSRALDFVRAIARDRRGGVLVLFGLSVLPLTFAVGMGIDYARAMRAQTKLNGIADAAALYAVSRAVMGHSDTAVASAADQLFRTQAATVLDPAHVHVTALTVSAPTDHLGRRTAIIRYRATSDNIFAGVLGVANLPIGGGATTTNASAPDIDFYMLLDVSGSMALPTTSEGLAKIANSNSKKCQFACHSSNDLKGTDATGQQNDLYGVAKSYGLTLRIDESGKAVSKLTTMATGMSGRNGAHYRMAIASFRGKGGFSVLQPLTTDLGTAATRTTDLKPALFYSNGCPTSACLNTEVGHDDKDTGTTDAFENVNGLIGTPGSGFNGMAPQAILFVITDGMRDEYRTYGRPEAAIDATKCDAIKTRGVRIAILHTEYLRESIDGDPWSETNVAPYLNQVEPALRACASPGLYTKVTTDQDMYTALDGLFQNAVATARISR